jgi:preprotein translocase subunit YajC
MFSSPAFAQAAAGGAAPGGIGFIVMQLLPLVALFAIFWFLIIRPQQQKLKSHRAMVDAVKKGDDVITGGGLVGKVSRVIDNEVEIELAPNVKVRAVKGTLSSVTPRGSPAAANDTKA